MKYGICILYFEVCFGSGCTKPLRRLHVKYPSQCWRGLSCSTSHPSAVHISFFLCVVTEWASMGRLNRVSGEHIERGTWGWADRLFGVIKSGREYYGNILLRAFSYSSLLFPENCSMYWSLFDMICLKSGSIITTACGVVHLLMEGNAARYGVILTEYVEQK